jgi:dTDP-4-amino-4,6-dideoxygalactose transaminase
MTDRIYLSPPHMSGEEARLVSEAFATNFIAPAGPALGAFEREFSELTGFTHCVALSSGTAAMHLALKGLDLQPGEEVWASTLTFIASIAPAVHERAIPVFIDSDEATWTMDPVLLEEGLARAAKQGRRPRAVIPTDIYGQSCDLDRIVGICKSYDVPVIADSAEAVGARYRDRHAGKGARAAVYSFNGNKIITASNGGMLATDDAALAETARHLATQAREPVPHYEHRTVGFNYRLSNICAAIGLGQLRALDLRVQRRRDIFSRYVARLGGLEGISFMPEATYGQGTRWLTVMMIDPEKNLSTPEIVRLALEARNIEARPVWKPMHMQPVFSSARSIGGQVASRLYEQGLCLPSGTAMSDDDVDRISQIVRDALRTH